MRVSMLKIDRSFMGGLEDDSGTAVLAASIVQLARNLGLEPLAEGIETEEQRRFLVDHGAASARGLLHPSACRLERSRRSTTRPPGRACETAA